MPDLQTCMAVSMLPLSRARAASAFNSVRHLDGSDLLEAVLDSCRVPPESWSDFIDQARDRTAHALKAASAAGIVAVPLGALQYPALLGCIVDPPPVLWTRGDLAHLTRPAVAVVGSRVATPYALEVAQRLGEELASRDVAVVSGLARGVDSAAHRGSLTGGGPTVAVLGSGLDRIYPPEHGELAVSVSRRGVLLSELGPGGEPLAEHFPLRNRIISGISLAVVVVEASEKSGSLITARYALEQGRDVMAVPGSILSGRNRGSHSLLKDGAKVVETADDILEELGWPSPRTETVATDLPKSLASDCLLLGMAAGEAYALEDLMALTGLAAPRLLARLTEFELRGLVTGVGGGRYVRNPAAK
jgi:DNA processing protein